MIDRFKNMDEEVHDMDIKGSNFVVLDCSRF
jgi:hypothetical protein